MIMFVSCPALDIWTWTNSLWDGDDANASARWTDRICLVSRVLFYGHHVDLSHLGAPWIAILEAPFQTVISKRLFPNYCLFWISISFENLNFYAQY